ncbi:MAG: FAD-dependent thymidylate synthase, partial [Alphaproteobacteria bacterium]
IEVGSSLMVAARSRTYATSGLRRPHHGIGDRAQSAQVVSIDFLGVEPTYDLEMEDPHHNFVANDIVVHNSFRYTGDRIIQAAQRKLDIEDVFYLRPVGSYSDRQGKKYEYTAEQRQEDLEWCRQGCQLYAQRIQQGLAEEHARGLIPFDVRQHWVMSGNARAIMHLLDIRGKFDVQPETRVMTEMMFEKFKLWMPEVAAWYEKNRWRKGTLAP